MSPTEAMKVAAVCTLTPGTLISRSTSGQASACLGDLGVEGGDLGVEEVDLAQTAVEREPLVERQLELAPASVDPPCRTASVTGGRSAGCAAKTPCASFFARVRARTSRSRRLVSRRSARVRSSGVHTSSSRPEPAAARACRASRRSVLALASVIERSLRVLATTTRTPWRCRSETIRSRSRRRLERDDVVWRPGSARTAPASPPASRSDPPSGPPSSSAIATSQKSRCTSNPNPAHARLLPRRGAGARRDTRQGRIRALGTPGQVAGAATNNVELAAHQSDRPARPRLPSAATRQQPPWDIHLVPAQRLRVRRANRSVLPAR